MRWTSTPMTPEPSPWRPNAAMASRARSRIAPSSPSRSAAAICSRSSSMSSSPASVAVVASPPPSSRTPCAHGGGLGGAEEEAVEDELEDAAVLGGLGQRRGERLAEVARARSSATSLERGEARRAARTCRWRRPRRAAPRRTRAAGRRCRAAGPAVRQPGCRGRRSSFTPTRSATMSRSVRCLTMTDIVSRKRLGVDVVGAEQQQRARPVDRLRDRRRLLEVELADHADHLDELARDRLRQLGRVQADDLELVLEPRVVEPQVQAAALERLGQLARVVGGQQHDRVRARLDAAQLRDRDLEVREDLEQHRLELLVGLVDLVDEQHDRLGRGDRRHQRALEQELLAEDVVLDLLPAGVVTPRPGCAAAACGSSTRTAPWPRRGPRSTAGARACGPGSAPAPWPARSCRRRPGPRRGPACRAGWRGRRRARWTRRAGSRREPRPARTSSTEVGSAVMGSPDGRTPCAWWPPPRSPQRRCSR